MSKQEASSADVGILAPVFKKSATEHTQIKITIVNIVTFNVGTLDTVNLLPELTASADKHNVDNIN